MPDEQEAPNLNKDPINWPKGRMIRKGVGKFGRILKPFESITFPKRVENDNNEK